MGPADPQAKEDLNAMSICPFCKKSFHRLGLASHRAACYRKRSKTPQRGSAGVERIVGRPEGKQQRDNDGSQLAPLVAPGIKSDKGGADCQIKDAGQCDICESWETCIHWQE